VTVKLLFTLLISLITAYAVSCFVTIGINPEVGFWNEAVSRRLDDMAQIRKKHPGQPIIIFTGGSSCAFSIDPRIVEETTGMPSINFGLPVSCGSRYLIHQAFRHAKPGDLVVIGTEPDLLTFPGQEASPSKLGFALEARQGRITEAAGGDTFGRSVSIPDYLSLSRPGPEYLITLMGRSFAGKGYRYKEPNIKHRGLIQTPIRDHSLKPGGTYGITSLHPEGRELLEAFAAVAKREGIRVAYSMPWSYTATVYLDQNRTNRRKILAEIESIMPVIEDGFSGTMDGRDNFSDGGRHLSDIGTAARSRALADALKAHLETR
jgi:hypothetical protein